ncbi:MAG: sulfatase [Sedimentisphaeraceae bacterium JB056]
MDRRFFLKLSFGISTGLAFAENLPITPTISNESARKPNVIIIYNDDQNFKDIACYGAKAYTPNQDKLAKQGIRFTRGYASTSICTPSRYSCLTGKYPSRCSHPTFLDQFPKGIQTEVGFNTLLEYDRYNLASVMKEAGYSTGMVGKWHLSDISASQKAGCPVIRSDDWLDGWSGSDNQPDVKSPEFSAALKENHQFWQDEIKKFGFDYADRIYATNPESFNLHSMNIHNHEWIVEGAVEFIEQNKNEPFFLYMAPTLNHIPHPQQSLLKADPKITSAGYLDKEPDVMPSRQEILEKVKSKGYPVETAYLTWLDEGIGAVVNKLEELELDKNTLIILSSDNQTLDKVTLYEGGINVPLIISYPDKIKQHQVSNELVQNIDFMPTIMDACNIKKPEEMGLDGKSLMPLLLGKHETIHNSLYFEIGWTRAVCTKRWKYIALRYSRDAIGKKKNSQHLYHYEKMRPHQHNSLLKHPDFWDEDQLYDMENDKNETTNLANDPQYEKVLAQMKKIMLEKLMKLGDHPFGNLI